MEIGAQVGRWVVGPALGRGGMAVVHQVTHADLGTRAALKVLHTTDPRVRGRMLREGRAQARLEHPNIVRVHDVVEVDGRAGLLMEYVDGPDLSVWIRSEARPVPVVLEVIRAISRALMAAHASNIVHRDLKPANVLMATGQVPKITDFGIAKILEDETEELRTRSGTAMGTPAYMPPEQIRSAGDIDTRADVYALGVVAYELLAGVRPYAATQDLVKAYTDAMSGSFVPLRERNAEVPESVEAAVHAALQGELDKRIPSVEAFLDVFDGRAEAPEPEGATTFLAEDALAGQPSDLVARVGVVELLKDGPVRHTWRAAGPSGPVLVRGLRADAATPKELDLAHREAEVLAQLSHPAIPRLIESFEGLHDGARWLFVVRQWVDGVSLAEESTRRRYTEEDVLAVLEEAAEILAYLHGLSPPVVHRDLRPSSFVRRTDGRLALVDFGHVRDAHPDTLGGHTIAGRFGFMAPEQFSGDASPATDAYGLGALAVALLGRKDPSELMDAEQAFRWRDTVKASAPVDTLLEGLLEPEPSDRVANAAEALRAVRRARKALLTHAERPSPMESLQEHLPPVPYKPMPPASPSASVPPQGVEQKSAAAAIAGSIALVLIAGMALLAITTIVVVSKTSRPPEARPPARGDVPSVPSVPLVTAPTRAPFAYPDPAPITGPVRVAAAIEVTAQVADGYVELRNATEDLVVLQPLTVATVDGRPVALADPSGRAELIPPGSFGRAKVQFSDERLRRGVTFSVAPTALRLTPAAPLVPSVPVTRYIEAEGLSCTANVRRGPTGGDSVTGWSCDWTGEGWLIVDPPKATLAADTTPVFRDSGLQAVAPGGEFHLDTTDRLETEVGNPFDGGLVIELDAAVRRADVDDFPLPELVYEPKPLK